jgi:shikimate kinase
MTAKFNEKNPNILLTGFMGAGKTTVGKMLSNTLQMPIVDSDQVIEQTCKKTISELFEESEQLFRGQETKFLQEHLSQENTIFSLGGGIIEKEENRKLINKLGLVFFLEVSFDILWDRIKDSSHRPLAFQKENASKKTALKNLYKKRLPLYQLANFTVQNNEDEKKSASQIAKIYSQGLWKK